MIKTIPLKKIIFFLLLSACFTVSAQLPAGKIPPAELKQMVTDLKKEIATIEDEIKIAEKDDPEGVPMLRTQLSVLKNMLAGLEKPKPLPGKGAGTIATNKATFSPISKITLKQPVPTPTSAQAKDKYFWYRGKKINDTTLITTKGTLVQYSSKRKLLIVQPEEKKDSFLVKAKEIARNEQRKKELVDRFDKFKNGFIYYPFINSTLALYDDLTDRYAKAVNNTFNFADNNIAFHNIPNQPEDLIAAKGPNVRESDFIKDPYQEVLEELEDARKKFDALPSIEDFPAPPIRELGLCHSCDTSLISKQRKLDYAWQLAYEGKENEIFDQACAAMHRYAMLVETDTSYALSQKFAEITGLVMARLTSKDKILADRYIDNLQYTAAIMPVILGHERRLQLLGNSEGSTVSELMGRSLAAYNRYYKEQAEAKNYDFILNVPYHLGVYRQLALLGADENSNNFYTYMNSMLAFNRFALTLDMDFVLERTADNELQLRAAGKMEMPDKTYTMLIPDSCSFKMIAYQTDLNNKTLTDITLPLKVSGGVKTMRDANNKLVDYPYSGPSEYALRFPDTKIDFCVNGKDTMLLAIMGGNEEVAARGASDLQKINKAYTIDMLIYASQALINEDAEELINGTQETGVEMLNNIAGFMQQQTPANTLDKIRIQYTGYMDMDNLRKKMEGSFSTGKAVILFNANNRSTVLTDTFIDTKRRMDDEVEIKKGLFHLRIVHEPNK